MDHPARREGDPGIGTRAIHDQPQMITPSSGHLATRWNRQTGALEFTLYGGRGICVPERIAGLIP